MVDRSSALAMVVSLLALHAVGTAQAERGYFGGRVAGGGPAEAAGGLWDPTPVPADLVRDGQIARQPVGRPQPWQPLAPPAASWPRPVRLPPTIPRSTLAQPYARVASTAGQVADGTWREDDRYIILNFNGQEVRLVKESQTEDPHLTPGQGRASGGTVYGELLHNERPLANCQVMIRPMIKTLGGYALNRAGPPLRTTTDGQGVYRFDHVPPGLYKLSWLPEATNQWIRRIAVRPDLTVRAHETTHVKAISKALRTMN